MLNGAISAKTRLLVAWLVCVVGKMVDDIVIFGQMLALQPGMDRLSHELSAQRDRQVRLQSVETDIALDLPPSIQLPDGEELPYGSSTRLHIRDPEQVPTTCYCTDQSGDYV